MKSHYSLKHCSWNLSISLQTKNPNPLLFKPYCKFLLLPLKISKKGKKNQSRFMPLSLHRPNLLQQNPTRWWFSNTSHSGQCLFSLFRKWEGFFLSLSSFPSARTQQEPEHIQNPSKAQISVRKYSWTWALLNQLRGKKNPPTPHLLREQSPATPSVHEELFQ